MLPLPICGTDAEERDPRKFYDVAMLSTEFSWCILFVSFIFQFTLVDICKRYSTICIVAVIYTGTDRQNTFD